MKTINKFTHIPLFATLFLLASLVGCNDLGTSANEDLDAPTIKSTSPMDSTKSSIPLLLIRQWSLQRLHHQHSQ